MVERLLPRLADDVEDLKDEVMARAAEQAREKTAELTKTGEREANALRGLLEDQLRQIEKRLGTTQLELAFDEAERRQYNDDRKHMQSRLTELMKELQDAPDQVKSGYVVQATRIEPIGLVYLWPKV